MKSGMQKRMSRLSKTGRVIKGILWMLIALGILTCLLPFLFFPVFKIYGGSMSPIMEKGDIVLAVKDDHIEKGDIIAFYCNNKILVKRVIAGAGEWIDIDDDGTVRVNNKELGETYLKEKTFGSCDIQLPCQIPDGKFFVMGDNRAESVDSRNIEVGCVTQEQIIGKILVRVWPIKRLGKIDEGGL